MQALRLKAIAGHDLSAARSAITGLELGAVRRPSSSAKGATSQRPRGRLGLLMVAGAAAGKQR